MSIVVHREESITIITIDRPQVRNAIDLPTSEALAEVFRDFENDASSAVAVLTGRGGHFCSGADLKSIGTPNQPRLDHSGDGPLGPTRMQLAKPVVAAIEGYAVAGGLELALWCDLRITAESAVLGVFCRRWGVPLIDGGTSRLPRTIGVGRALDLILTGRPVTAPEALEMGLISQVCPDGTALETAVRLAKHIAGFPQECMLADRANVYDQIGRPQEEALRREFERSLSMVETSGVSGAERFKIGAGRHGIFDSEDDTKY